MNAAVVHAFDAPPHYTTFADPVAGDGEKIVKVTAAGLHPIVKALATGLTTAAPENCRSFLESMGRGGWRTARECISAAREAVGNLFGASGGTGLDVLAAARWAR